MRPQEHGQDVALESAHQNFVSSTDYADIDQFSYECYENDVPLFVSAELDRLYGSVFSTMLQLRISGEITADTSTYIARCGQRIEAIFLFRCEGARIRVLNKRICVNEEQIRLFSDYIFKKYKSASTIVFQLINTDTLRIPYPYQSAGCPGELVIELPATPEDYLAALGKNTRRNIKYYLGRLTRTFPSFRMEFYDGSAASEQDIRAIIEFNRKRTIERNDVYFRSEEEVQRVIALTRAYGVVGVARINDVVCGGTIGYMVGENFIGAITAHDPQYNEYTIGTLILYLTICESIVRGSKRHNCMQGNNEYKRRLGAQMQDLRNVAIYRSKMHMLLNAHAVTKMAYADFMYQLTFAGQEKRQALENGMKSGDLDFRSKFLLKSLNMLRGSKHFLSRISVFFKSIKAR
jgi:hypothetical protein